MTEKTETAVAGWVALVAKLHASEFEKKLARLAAEWMDARHLPIYLSRNIETDKATDDD